LVRYSNNGSTTSAVNFPEVALPEHTGRSRLLHIHRNVPGVMARVNERLSAAGMNVLKPPAPAPGLPVDPNRPPTHCA
jgi:D-3-phosphoglycerate dehydrogenase